MLGNCLRCGASFIKDRPTSKYCSSDCCNKMNGDKRARRKVCVECKASKPLIEFNRNDRFDRSKSTDTCQECAKDVSVKVKAARPWYNSRLPQMIINCKNRAKALGLPCTITRHDIVIPEFCPVLGVRFEDQCVKREGTKFGLFAASYSPSIDRIDNTKGYTPDNIVIVSCRVNSIKGNATIKELIAIARFYTKLAKQKGLDV